MPLVRPIDPTWAIVLSCFATPDSILANTVEPATIYANGIDLLARVPHHQSAKVDKVRLDQVDCDAFLVEKAAYVLGKLNQRRCLEDDPTVLFKHG